MAGLKNKGSSTTNSTRLPKLLSDCKESDNAVSDDIVDEDGESVYPINTKPLANQVAGHAFKDGKHTVGMLKHKDGYVLKPVNRPLQGEKEIKFYEEMQNIVNPLLIEFKTFIPKYYGTTVLELQGKKITFLLLEDITNGFLEPCVMDLKIGKQTWEPGASIEKQLSEQKKYIESRHSLHFCIPGFQIYDIKTGVFKRYGKGYGKQLGAEGVYEALRIFFNAEYGVSEHVLVPMLLQLKEILKWWKRQNVFHIYSSSVLLAYDASVLKEVIKNKCNEVEMFSVCSNCHFSEQNRSTKKDKSWLCVYLIDFAHVIPAENNVLDLNYISGLTSLINVFEELLNELRLRRNCSDNKVE